MPRSPRNAPADEPERTAVPSRTRTALVAKPALRTGGPAAENFEEALTSPATVPEPMMTRYASRSLMVAETVQADLERKRYGARPGWRLKVADPHGPSTDGGLKARQALLLVPWRGEGITFQCGWLDAARMIAQLRSWEALCRRQMARFGTEPEVGQEAYERFLDDCRKSLSSCELEIRLAVPDDEPIARAVEPTPPTRAPSRVLPWVVLAFLAGLAVGLLARI